MKPFLKTLSIAACLLSLSACETVEGLKRDISDLNFDSFTPASSVSKEKHADFLVDGNCPQVQIVEDLGRLYEFNSGQSQKSTNLVSSVIMDEAQSSCIYSDRSVTVDLKLAFDGQVGPKGRRSSTEKPFFSYPFFVAVTSDNGKILAKEIFAASMTYDPGQNEKMYFETLRQIIPADSRAQGSRYKVMVGFQLSESQLTYNRQLIEAERVAAAKLEAERLEAERLAAEQAKQEAKAAEKAQAQTDVIETSEAEIETSTETENRAGPFDIFKSND